MIRRWQKFLFFVYMCLASQACGQGVPENRPTVTDHRFDDMLTTLLPFGTPLIGVDSVYRARDNHLLLDTRSREEYAVSHIPGAIWVGYGDDLQWDTIGQLPRDRPVVLYCSVGYRSDQVGQQIVEKMGFPEVYNIYGSIFEWANRGYPLENEQGKPTRQLHTYSQKWSRWVADSSRIQKIW